MSIISFRLDSKQKILYFHTANIKTGIKNSIYRMLETIEDRKGGCEVLRGNICINFKYLVPFVLNWNI